MKEREREQDGGRDRLREGYRVGEMKRESDEERETDTDIDIEADVATFKRFISCV